MAALRRCPIVCDVSGLAPDASALDLLARLQLTARRHGLDLRLRHVSQELNDLLELAGLQVVLRVETSGQAEERKECRGVEEERELDDPAG
jgi:anti-anti-sigma regulatory factor